MKKTLLAAALLLGALTISAQDYTHSIGATVGNLYGVSYKGFIFGVEGLALQADLGVKLSNFGKSSTATTYVHGNGFSNRTTTSTTSANSNDYFTFEVNPNIVYQRDITSGGWGKLSWYAGGGISLGMMKSCMHGNLYWDDNFALHNSWWAMSHKMPGTDNQYCPLNGKFGFNAIGGVEMSLAGAPIVIGLDFRPGYGMGFDIDKTGGITTETQVHFFDWTLAASVRYRL